VSNTIVADNDGFGIRVRPTGSAVTVQAAFSHVITYNNVTGIIVDGGGSTGTLSGVIADSVSTSNGFGYFSA
jgi:hypothetical protein